jgi:NCS2 family nucleobase:cation symporter-2
MYGALICAGVFGLLVAYPFSRVLRLFPPLVTGTVITVIGLSLISAATGLITGTDTTAKSYAQPSHIALAAGIVGIIVLVTRFGRGLLGQTAVLIGIVAGTLIAAPMHLTNFSAVGQAGWFGLTRPFRFGAPRFDAAAIISMCVVMLVTYTESTADMLAVGEMVDRPLSKGDVARGLAVDGLSAVLGGIFNSFADTAYAQNVGLVGMTRIRSRYVVTVTGVLLIALGLVPKIGAIVAGIPGPVVGGAALVMFAMVSAVGIRTLHRVPFDEGHNLFVVAVSLGVGLVPVVAPNVYEHFPTNFQVIFGSSITSTVIVVFALNLFFHHLPVGQRPRSGESLPDAAEAVTR